MYEIVAGACIVGPSFSNTMIQDMGSVYIYCVILLKDIIIYLSLMDNGKTGLNLKTIPFVRGN